MLDEHLLDGVFGDVRVDRRTVYVGEVVERPLEALVGAALLADQLQEPLRQFGDLVLELRDGMLPLFVGGRLVLHERLDRLDKRLGLSDVVVEDFPIVLPNDGVVGGLEEDIVARVAALELPLDFIVEIVVGVLGLPDAVDELERVEHCAVHADAVVVALHRVLFGERQPQLTPASAQEIGKRGRDGAFGEEMEAGDALDLVEVLLDGLVARFQVEAVHGVIPSVADNSSRCFKVYGWRRTEAMPRRQCAPRSGARSN